MDSGATVQRGWWATALCALVVAAGLLGRDTYLFGSAWWLLRWPCLLTVLLLLRRRAGPQRVLAAVLAVVICTELTWLAVARAASPDLEPQTRVTLVTHNLLFRGADMAASLEALLEGDADVLALQEVTPTWSAQLDAALATRWPHREAFVHRGTHGLSVYARFPLSKAVLLGSASAPFAQCLEVETPSRPVALCNVHLASPAGPLSWANRWARVPGLVANAAQRAEQWAAVETELTRRSPLTRLAMGDFNTMEVEPLYRDIRRGWVDAFRAHSWQWGATWPWRVRRVAPFVRIDYVFVSGPAVPLGAAVIEPSGSDHRPVRAVIGW